MIFELQKFVNCQRAGSFYQPTYELMKVLGNKEKSGIKPVFLFWWGGSGDLLWLGKNAKVFFDRYVKNSLKLLGGC